MLLQFAAAEDFAADDLHQHSLMLMRRRPGERRERGIVTLLLRATITPYLNNT